MGNRTVLGVFETILYKKYIETVPDSGKHILAYQTDDSLVVYMAFNDAIADYAVEHQKLGGDSFSFNRMSWIKPGFLWMMYRSGWADKENQNRILALWISKKDFEKILSQTVHSSFDEKVYGSRENWRLELKTKKVRLQWDPDHDPHGNNLERKAIQLGLKGKMLRLFATGMVMKIEDVTEFVKTQKNILKSSGVGNLMIPNETVFKSLTTALL